MAITDLIAQQQGPDVIGALGRAYQLKGMQQALAAPGKAEAERKKQEGAKFAANTALQLEKVQDPLQKAQLYQRQLQAAEQAGYDIRPFPMQYDERAQGLLSFFKSQIYGGQEYEAELNKKPISLKAGSQLVDPTTGRQIAAGNPPPPATNLGKMIAARDALPEGDPNRSLYDAAIKKETESAPGQDKTFDRSTKLRQEFIKGTDDFRKQNDAYGRITASAADPSAAGDLSLIFNYMKLLDPGSVVRESEFATAANSAGVDDRVRNVYNKLLTGERLAPDQRNDFVGRANKLYQQAVKQHGKTVDEYTRISKSFGLDPAQIIIERSTVDQPGTQQAIPDGTTATNPQTGEKLIFRGGQWQPM